MAFPSKTKQITIKENSYTINYPNNRQSIAIAARKEQLSRQTYDSLTSSNDAANMFAGLLIEAIANFEVLMPEQFFKDLNFQSIVDADIIAGANLLKVYRDQYMPWKKEWDDVIADILNGKTEGKVAADSE
jgi:hypothetical protein